MSRSDDTTWDQVGFTDPKKLDDPGCIPVHLPDGMVTFLGSSWCDGNEWVGIVDFKMVTADAVIEGLMTLAQARAMVAALSREIESAAEDTEGFEGSPSCAGNGLRASAVGIARIQAAGDVAAKAAPAPEGKLSNRSLVSIGERFTDDGLPLFEAGEGLSAPLRNIEALIESYRRAHPA